MANLVSVVHPYTYKLNGTALMYGPIEEHSERDRKIAEFIEGSLDLGTRVLVHHHIRLDEIMGMMYAGAFGFDGLKILFDERVETAVTSHYGLPLIIDEGREKEVSKEMLEMAKKFFTSHEEMQAKMRGVKNHFFMGGVLENCMFGAINYFKKDNPQQALYCVRKLCVSNPTPDSLPLDIPMITPKEALRIMRES